MDIDNYLTCNFCNKKFDLFLNKPRMIFKCGHSICNKCLENSLKLKKSFIICPKDNKKIILENKTIENFPENFAILKNLKNNNTNDYEEFKIKNDFENKLDLKKSFNNEFEENKLENEYEKNIFEKNNFEKNKFENRFEKLSDLKNGRSQENFKNLNMKFKKRYSMKDWEIGNNFEVCKIHDKILEIFCYNCNEFICYKCGLFGIHNVF